MSTTDTSTMTAEELHDEITLRLEQLAGTVFMFAQGAHATCCDIPSDAPLVAGFGLRREILEIRELCSRMDRVRAAEEHAQQAAPIIAAKQAEEFIAKFGKLPVNQQRIVGEILQDLLGRQQGGAA